jgi:hypothetical protein
MTWDELGHKFAGCAAVAATPLAPARIAKTQGFVRVLQDAKDATLILELLA